MHVYRATLVVCLLTALGMSAIPGRAQTVRSKPDAAKPDSSQTKPDGARSLPLRRVTLYKSGVGYFEHGGIVHGDENVEIKLTSSQLNDVLESLTALDLNGGHISGASYNSQDPASHQLQAVSVPVAQTNTLAALLGQLRGAEVELSAGATAFTGRVLSVEDRSRGENGVEVHYTEVALMSDGGEERQFPVDGSTKVKFADAALERELARALGLMDAERSQDTRRLILSATGAGARELRVSYISEVPVWKTTYRIVLPSPAQSNAKPLLQGWAIVDNTVGEDWENVQLSLAAGAPQSFIQAISQPYYTQRPVVPMPKGFLLSPQTHEATLVGALQMNSAGVPKVGSVTETVTVEAQSLARDTNEFALVAPSVSNSGAGFGMGSGTGAGLAGRYDSRSWYALQSTVNGAANEELGEIFEYNLKDAVTIRKNESALVPIVQTDITAEKVSLWNASTGARPLLALWLTNSSAMTLDGGSFSVVDAGAFSGEGLMDPVQPGERRLISYAGDLAVQVVANADIASETVTHVRILRGVIYKTSEVRERVSYKIRNEDTAARVVVIEHPNRGGWKLAENLKPEEIAADVYRFRVLVASKQTAELSVEERKPNIAEIAIRDLNLTSLQFMADGRELSPEAEQALRDVLARKDAIAEFARQIAGRQSDYDEIFKDQSRLRDNLKALQSTPEQRALAQRYTKEMDEQETRLENLRTDIKLLTERKNKAQTELDGVIEKLQFDMKI